MTVGRPPPLYRGDSRLRGNDGGGDRRPSTVGIPAYAGMTVGGDRRPSTVGIPAYAGRTVGAVNNRSRQI